MQNKSGEKVVQQQPPNAGGTTERSLELSIALSNVPLMKYGQGAEMRLAHGLKD